MNDEYSEALVFVQTFNCDLDICSCSFTKSKQSPTLIEKLRAVID